MKNLLKKLDIKLPWFKEIISIDDFKHTMNSRFGEYVLKPTDSRGSRGVIRVTVHLNAKKLTRFL